MDSIKKIYANLDQRLTAPICAVLIFVFGLIGIAVLDVGHAPDVWTHTYRVAGILNGDIIVHPVDSTSRYHSIAEENWGGAVPEDVVQLSVEYYNDHDPGSVLPDSITQRSNGNAEVPYNNTAVYSPVAYLPQLIGFTLGDMFGNSLWGGALPALAKYYLAEFIMLIVWTWLCTAAVMSLPRHRLAMLIVVLLPPVWFPAAFAISADSFSLALVIYFSCMLYRCMCQKPTMLDCALLSLAGFLLANAKFAYAPLFVLALWVPIRWKSAKGRFAMIIVAFLAAIATCLLWMRLGTSGFATSPSVVSYTEYQVRATELLSNPAIALGHIFYSITHFEGVYFMGSQGVAAFWIACVIILVALIAVAVRGHIATLKAKAVGIQAPFGLSVILFWVSVLIVVVFTALVSYLALYLQYNPADNPGVLGIQYRYFIPYVPLGALMLFSLRNLWACCVQTAAQLPRN